MRPSSSSLSGLLALFICAVTTVLPGYAAAERDSLKLLTIGNSFSNDALGYLSYIAEAGGKKLVVDRASLGGCSLERHARHLREADAGDAKGKAYNGRSLPEILASQPWDIVTIQQWSQLSFKPETFQPHADELIAAIRKHAPAAEIVVHQTWAYREDHPWFQKDDGFTPAKMYAGLTTTYRDFADSKSFRILPVGDAMNLARKTARWTFTPDASFDLKNPPAGQLPDQRTSLNIGWHWTKPKDGAKPKLELDAIHCNAAGKYLAGCVWYLQLFNTTELPTSYTPKDLTPADTAELRPHALAAVEAERARVAKPALATN